MRELGLSVLDQALVARRPGKRSRTRDERSWGNGAARGNASRWGLNSLPSIDPDDPLADLESISLTPSEE